MSRCHVYLLIGLPPGAPGVPGRGKPKGLKAAGLPARASWDRTELAPVTGGPPRSWAAPGKALVGGSSPGKPGNISAGLGAPGEAPGPMGLPRSKAAAAAAAAAEKAAADDVGTGKSKDGDD